MARDIIEIILALPSQHVIFGTISTVLCIAAVWVYSNSSNRIKMVFLQTTSYLVIFNEIAFQMNMVYYGIWSYKTSLPLEMCYISALLVPFYAKYKNLQPLKTWFFFAGFGGSLFAFINTNLSESEQIYVSIHYFFAHGLVIFVMLSLVADGYRPSWNDYFNAIKMTTFLVVIIVFINLILDSNYMFTFEKPSGTNFTMLMPEWPFYFIMMLAIGLAFYTLMMVVSFAPAKK
tara:strand:+ start:61555 stop:62250 length:696 start_codon:yes stop_codon:yes gene_type:complete